MAYSRELAERIRNLIPEHSDVYERSMFGGRCFMMNGKMLVCAGSDHILFRVGAPNYDEALDQEGARPMVNNGRLMRGFVFVDQAAVESDEELECWLRICISFNNTLVLAQSTD